MELTSGLSALVTGGASGIGRGLCLALGAKGVFVTVVDYSEEKGDEVASLVRKENEKFHSNLKFPSAVFRKCDVTNTGDISAAFDEHVAMFGGLDICINSAGVAASVPFYEDQTDGTQTWKRTVKVNFIAIIECTHLAIRKMQALQKPGVIINMGSASGLYPMIRDPIYSGSKGGVVLFTRSLVTYKNQGIRVNVLCPEFVETEMGLLIDPKIINITGGFISMETVVKGAFELITDESKAGSCLWITNRRGMEYWPTPAEEKKYLVDFSSMRNRTMTKAPLETPFSIQLPESYEKLVVHTLTHNFRNATQIVRAALGIPIKPHHVLVKIIYAGVNASDVVNADSMKLESDKLKRCKKTLVESLYLTSEAQSSVMERVKKLEANLAPEFPRLVKVMTASNVTGCFCLNLSRKFCIEHLPNQDTTIVLEDESGIEFQTKYLVGKKGLSAGWRAFSIFHKLLVGDVVVFQRVTPSKFKSLTPPSITCNDLIHPANITECKGAKVSIPSEPFQKKTMSCNTSGASLSDQSGNDGEEFRSEVLDGIKFAESVIPFEEVTGMEKIRCHNQRVGPKF